MVLTGWKLRLSKGCCIPQRYIMGIMGFFAVVNAYSMRVALSIAITEMVPVKEEAMANPETCKENIRDSKPAVKEKNAIYNWDEQTQGLILGAFYWGYIVTHIPGGVLAERFGGKHALGLGILSTAIFTVLTPVLIIQTKGNSAVMIVTRVIMGAGEGTTYPALSYLIAKWVPLSERSRIGTLVFAGSQMGTILCNSLSGMLIQKTGHWSSVFYLFGGLGLLWFVLWCLLCFSEPATHPYISDKEKEYLEKELGNVTAAHSLKKPWKAIFTSVPIWALTFSQIGHDWGFYTMVSDLPKYLKDVLKFNVEENGLWSSLPYLLMWIMSMLSGYLCDLLITKKKITVTFARKLFTTIASFFPSVFLVLASYMGCHQIKTMVLFSIGMGFMGPYYCGMRVNALDLAPNYSGTIMAITNAVGALTGIATPFVVALVAPNHTVKEWRIVFWIAFAIFNVTNIIYIIFASGEEQWWNNPENEKPQKPPKAGPANQPT